jgi:hypothetical protein
MGLRIDHALVMDTDHLPGGGGYAVAGVSDGVWESERLFAAQNFGISDFLHDPQNARVYFSFFRVPNGRFAFVRRFAHGRRRSGVQNRLFVHTFFLDPETLAQLHLPWLLPDAVFRIGRSEPAPLTLDVAPLLADPAFPPLELIEAASAPDQLKVYADAVETKLPAGSIATVLETLSRGTAAALPQGRAYEQLSLVAWSMLPPLDRETIAWTQHDAGNLGGISFGIANVANVGTGFSPSQDGLKPVPTSFQRIVAVNTRRDGWLAYQAQTREHKLRITSRELFPWLDFHEANAELFSDPNASDDVIVARLTKLASAIHQRNPWVNEKELLRAVWSLSAGRGGVDRAIRLFTSSGIGAVVFREPPSRDWLSASETQVGAEAVTRFFVEATRDVPAAAATREAVASWLLERKAKDVTTTTLVRLAALVDKGRVPLLRSILEREDGVASLIAAPPGDAVYEALELALRMGHAERKALVRALVPQLDGERLEPIASDIGELLRDDAEEFVRFVSGVPPAAAGRVNESVATWLKFDRTRTLPLVRTILGGLERQAYPDARILPAVFLAAGAGEAVASWLPFVLRKAELIDGRRNAGELQYFTNWTNELRTIDAAAMTQILEAFRHRVASRAAIGPALRALVDVARPAWAKAGEELHAALEANLQHGATAVEWESMIMAVVRPAKTRAQAALLATFWRRLDAKDVPRLQPATVDSLSEIAPEHRDTVVARWMESIRRLPGDANSEDVVRLLAAIAPDALATKVQIEREWRDLLLGRGTVETLMRLDHLLYDRENRLDEIRTAVPYLLPTSTASRAAELVHIAAAGRTPPTTRRVIETELLRPELAKLRGDAEWLPFLDAAEESLFAWRNLTALVDVSLHGARKAEKAAAHFTRMSQKAGRH